MNWTEDNYIRIVRRNMDLNLVDYWVTFHRIDRKHWEGEGYNNLSYEQVHYNQLFTLSSRNISLHPDLDAHMQIYPFSWFETCWESIITIIQLATLMFESLKIKLLNLVQGTCKQFKVSWDSKELMSKLRNNENSCTKQVQHALGKLSGSLEKKKNQK